MTVHAWSICAFNIFFKDRVCSGSILITGDKVVNEIGFLPYAVANEKIAQRNGMSDDVT